MSDLPLTEAIEACDWVLAGLASERDNRPALWCGQLLDGHLVSSDANTVHLFTFAATTEGDELLVPRAALAWVEAIKPDSLRWKADRDQYIVRLTGDEHEVVAEVIDPSGNVERSQRFDGAGKWNFPPVTRLVENFTEAEEAWPATLNPEHLGRLASHAKRYKRPAAKLQLSTVSAGKVGTVLFTAGPVQLLSQSLKG